MPARKKHVHVSCQFFRWRLFQRNEVFYADGRFENLNLGKHSLGTRDRAEAEANLRKLDHRKAVENGLARDTGVDPNDRLAIQRGWELYLEWCERPEVMGGVSRKTLNKYKRSGVLSNSRPKGPLGLKRDDEAIWGNLPKTRTNRRRIALPVVRSPALGDADVYEGRFGATLYLQAICGDRELLLNSHPADLSFRK
jgi:hypothetical protein